MCGIAGIYNLNGEGVDSNLLRKMTQKLAHRGPDDEGVFADGPVGLGHRRLSIIDVSKLGHQPMSNEDDTIWIAYNGEIYNFLEIRESLVKLGHKFRSKTDTEVVLHSYEQWGADCLEKFNGMFAFAIFDKKSGQFFLARDRFGKKPLYYYLDSEKFVFASEIKAILEDNNILRQINPQGIANFFTFGHGIGPDTIFQKIKKLLPGRYLIIKNKEIKIKEYWDLRIFEKKEDKGLKYYQEKISEIFEDSVEKRLISDVPLGVFLSGGLDSSSVAAAMAKYCNYPVKTFSVGFDVPGKEFNELSDAKVISDYFKTQHHQIVLKENDLLDNLDKIVYHFDEPFGDAANFPIFCMSRLAKDYVKVVLTGEGADEIFGGYRRYMVENNLRKLSLLIYFLRNNSIKNFVNSTVKFRKIKQLLSTIPIKENLLRQTNWLVCFSGEMREQLFLPQLAGGIDVLKFYKEKAEKCRNKNLLEDMMYLDQKVLLPDCYLEKIDKATMAFGLEARAPFLDYRLAELAQAMPSKYKINGLKTKYIFKQCMKNRLPDRILNKGKHGFAVPTGLWFKGKLKNYLGEIIFDSKTRSRGYFNFDYIEKIYKQYQEKKYAFNYQFWLLLNFELWHRQFIDQSGLK